VRAELQSRRCGDGSPSKNGRGQGKNDHRAEHCGLRGPKSPSPRQANPSNRRKIGRSIMARMAHMRPCAAVPGEVLGRVSPVLAPLCMFLWAPLPSASMLRFLGVHSGTYSESVLFMLFSICSSCSSCSSLHALLRHLLTSNLLFSYTRCTNETSPRSEPFFDDAHFRHNSPIAGRS
jgi:hypothetical protein